MKQKVYEKYRATSGPNKGMVVDDGKVIEDADFSVEHISPVVVHYNEKGWNQTKEQRVKAFNSDSNLIPISKKENRFW